MKVWMLHAEKGAVPGVLRQNVSSKQQEHYVFDPEDVNYERIIVLKPFLQIGNHERFPGVLYLEGIRALELGESFSDDAKFTQCALVFSVSDPRGVTSLAFKGPVQFVGRMMKPTPAVQERL